jgi:Holliday junction resolvase RusA-like endonuclease
MVGIELSYPPSVNHYWRRFGPRTLISRAGRAYRTRVCLLLAARRVRPLVGPLAVHIDVIPPDRRRRDVDNLLKATLDALEYGGVYHDDSQIVSLSISKRGVVPGGRALIRVEQTEADETAC